MVRKLISLASFILVISLALSGCNHPLSADSGADKPSHNNSQPVVEEPPAVRELDNLNGKKIAAVVLIKDQFQRMLQITMKKTAERYGATVIEGQSGGELDNEVELINQYAAGDVDGICIFPVSPTGSAAALENAAKNGVTIYCANINMDYDWQTGYAKMDQYNIGEIVGGFCADYIKKNFPGRKPKTAIIQFTALLPEMSAQRTSGFLSKTEDLIEIVKDVDAWNADDSVNVAAEIINAHPDLDLIFCANEGGTVGTVMAIKNAGKTIPVFGIDISEQLVNLLLDPDNILQALGGQDPIALGETSMENLCLAMMGKDYRTGVLLPGIPLTREDPEGAKVYLQELLDALE